MDNKQKAIDLFTKHTNFKIDDIIKIKPVHKGYTNISFLFLLKNKKRYQVRLGLNNEIVNRSNELKMMKYLPYKYFLYMDENGNAIKEWITGFNPKFIFKKKKLITLLCSEIEKFHNTEYDANGLLVHDYFEYAKPEQINKYQDYFNKYKSIIEKMSKCKNVLSHNDINPWNMIYSRKLKQIILIDFEWSRINNEYFDVANFFRETNLSFKWLKFMASKLNLDYQTLKEMVFACCFFAYMWTFNVEQTKKLLNYRKTVEKKLKKIYCEIF